MKIAAILTLGFLGADARMSFGKCPPVTMQSNFDVNQFAGKWYEIERDGIFTWEMGQECVTEHFYEKNGEMSLHFRMQLWMALWTYPSVSGRMKCENSNADKTCDMNLDVMPADKWGEYNLMSTDYSSYAINYICKDVFEGGMRMEWLNIMSRDTTMSDATLAQAKSLIAAQLPEFDLSGWSMHTTVQGDVCTYDWTL
jgi:lipocalin